MKKLIPILFLLPLMMAFVIPSKPDFQNVDWNDCLEKYGSAWGEDCLKCPYKKDTYKVKLKNTCTDALDVVVCVQEIDKTWKYSLFNGVPPRDSVIAYACKGTGKYLKFVRKAGNKEIILPTADQVNAQYKE